MLKHTRQMRKNFVLTALPACVVALVGCATAPVDPAVDELRETERKVPDAGGGAEAPKGSKDLVLRPASALPGDGFGAVLARSADGTVLVVGAPTETSEAKGVNPPVGARGTSARGAAFVFRRDADSNWKLEAYLKPSNVGINGFSFGAAVAVSADGGVVAVGAPAEDSESKGVNSKPAGFLVGAGAAYVFGRSGDSWVQTAYIKSAAPATKAAFGSSVALAMNGALLAVGTPAEAGVGRVYTYTRASNVWAAGNVIKVPAGATASGFGVALSIAESGDTLAVGADRLKAATGGQVGAAHLFVRDVKGAWSLQATLQAASAREGEGFGTVLSLSPDGQALAAGVPGEKGSAKGVGGDASQRNERCATGAVYVYRRSAAVWGSDAYVKAARPACADAAGDRFGASVAMGDANTLWVGAPGVGDGAAAARGEVHLLRRQTTWTLEREAVAQAPKAGQGVGLSLSGSGTVVSGTQDGSVLVFAK